MKLITKKTLIIIAVAVILISLTTGALLAYYPLQMSQEHTTKIANMFLQDMGFNKQSFYNLYQPIIQESTIKSSKHNHNIPIKYFKNESYIKPTIILVHWHETDHTVMLPLAEMFIKQGYNVVLYDQRAHGNNTAKIVTFGYYEQDDLQDVINFVKSKAKNVPIGVLGQSMGASTLGFYIGTDHAKNSIDFAIIESPFSNMYQELEYNIHFKLGFKLPVSLALNVGSMFNKIINGFTFKEVSITKHIKNTSIPTLIMHSKDDTVCPYSMGKEVYEAMSFNNNEMVTFNNTKHVTAFFTNRGLYEKKVINFINKYIKK